MVGLLDVAVVTGVAVLVFGKRAVPQAARIAGRLLGSVVRTADSARGAVVAAARAHRIGEAGDGLRRGLEDLQSIRSDWHTLRPSSIARAVVANETDAAGSPGTPRTALGAPAAATLSTVPPPAHASSAWAPAAQGWPSPSAARAATAADQSPDQVPGGLAGVYVATLRPKMLPKQQQALEQARASTAADAIVSAATGTASAAGR